MRNSVYKNISIGIVAFVIIYISMFLGDNGSSTVYKYLFLLPLIHGIIMLVFAPVADEMLVYPSQIIIYALYFIRNVITPLLLAANDFKLGINITSESDVNLSIALMLYETFMVFIVLSRRLKVVTPWSVGDRDGFLNYGAFQQRLFNVMLFGLFFITIVIWITVPSLRDSFDSLFNIENLVQIANNVDKDELSSSTRALYTIGAMLVTFCRFFVTLWVLYKIRQRSSRTSVGIISALVIALIQMTFISSQLMFAFYILFFILFATIKLWPGSKRIMLGVFGTAMAAALVILPFIKGGFTSWDAYVENLGSSLQAYLPGIANVAGTVKIERTNVLNTIFADFYTMIPFRNSLFGLQVTNLTEIFCERNDIAGQILPLVGESYHYFGFVFSPILSMLFAKGAIHAEERMHSAKHIFSYGTYTMFMLYLSSMIVCKNFILFGSTFTSTLLPMVIMCKFVDSEYDFSNLQEE
ncbi:MAG: hypothetical protein LUH14_05995 [Clostridiaceae bacterium]|nr:hypothetical protein [Clostridiaceae bacterium]